MKTTRKPDPKYLDLVRRAIYSRDSMELANILDKFKGSYAAMYISIVLLETGNQVQLVEVRDTLKRALLC